MRTPERHWAAGRNLKHLLTLLDDIQALSVAFVSLPRESTTLSGLQAVAATVGAGPLWGNASLTTPSAFRAAFNKRPSARLQFLLECLNELHGFKVGVNDHGVLIQIAPRQYTNLVRSILPLHIATLALEFKDPSDRHVGHASERGHSHSLASQWFCLQWRVGPAWHI